MGTGAYPPGGGWRRVVASTLRAMTTPPYPPSGGDPYGTPGEDPWAQPGYGQPGYGQQPGYGPPGYGPPAYGPPPQGGPVYGYLAYDPLTGEPLSDKSKVVAGLLQIFLPFGIGRFYMGDTQTGVLQLVVTLVTCGIGGIWGFIDGILILVNGGYDAEGRKLRDQ